MDNDNDNNKDNDNKPTDMKRVSEPAARQKGRR